MMLGLVVLSSLLAPWVQARQPLAELGTKPIPVTVAALAKGSTGTTDLVTLERTKGGPIELTVALPPEAPLPFAVGDRVTILVGGRPVRPGAPVRDVGTVVVRDARGKVLLALGDRATVVPGFKVADGEVVSGEDEGSHVTERRAAKLAHGRARTSVAPETWQVWTAGRERFAVWASVRTSRLTKGGPPLPPDFVGAARAFAIVRLADPVAPRKIDGYASVDRRDHDGGRAPLVAEVGAVVPIGAGDRPGHEVTFTRAAPAKDLVATIRLPRGLALPFRVGDRVSVALGVEGGGPNARGTLVVLDTLGEPLLVIAQGGTLVPGLTIEEGPEARVRPSGDRRQHDHPVIVTKGGEAITLPLEGGVTWTTGGRRYAAWGAAARMEYPPGKPRVPDSVGGWLDVALVRVP